MSHLRKDPSQVWDRPTSQKERKDPSHSGEHAPKTQQVHLIWGRHGRNPEPRVLAHHKTQNLQVFPPDSWLCFAGPFRGFRGPCLILPKKGSLGLPAPNAIGGNSDPSCAGKMKESYHLVLVQHSPPPPTISAKDKHVKCYEPLTQKFRSIA